MTKQHRGFAKLDEKRRREIAASGGAAVPGEKRSFSRDRELAKAAGAKGGKATRGKVKRKPELMEATG